MKDYEYGENEFAGQVEETYLEQKTQLMSLRTSLAPRHDAREITVTAGPSHPQQRTILPRIQLPHFFGRYVEWLFRDLFQSVIGKDASITDVEKLHYLKVNLKGEAEVLIRDLSTISDNYRRAWDILTAHFENKRLLVRSYFSAFTSLAKMKSESAVELKKIVQCMVTTSSSLESIERPISSCKD